MLPSSATIDMPRTRPTKSTYERLAYRPPEALLVSSTKPQLTAELGSLGLFDEGHVNEGPDAPGCQVV